jgi:hypothetical protein
MFYETMLLSSITHVINKRVRSYKKNAANKKRAHVCCALIRHQTVVTDLTSHNSTELNHCSFWWGVSRAQDHLPFDYGSY